LGSGAGAATEDVLQANAAIIKTVSAARAGFNFNMVLLLLNQS